MINIKEIFNTIKNLRDGKLVVIDTEKLADWLEYLTRDYLSNPEEVITNVNKFENELIIYLKIRDIIFMSKDIKSDTIEYRFSYYRDEKDKEFEHLITNGILRLAEHFNLNSEIKLENNFDGFIRDLVVILK